MCDNHARIGMVVNMPDHTVIIKNTVRNVPGLWSEPSTLKHPATAIRSSGLKFRSKCRFA